MAVETSEALDGKAGDQTTGGAPSGRAPRRGRARATRSRSIRLLRVTRHEALQAVDRALELEAEFDRPKTRVECAEAPRPCPHVSCRHHLYLDVNPHTGTIKLNFPDLEVWELGVSCALDVAERNGITLEEVGEIMNLTRERVRQVEVRGLLKLKLSAPEPAPPFDGGDD